MRPGTAIPIILLALGTPVAGNDLNDYESLSDWGSLPNYKPGIVAGLASSYDRTGGNTDYNYYELPPGFQDTDVETVIATLTGPGIVTRIWMPHATADGVLPIRMTVDGVVQIDTTSDVILGGNYGYIQSPLVRTLVGGQCSYEPIAFQNSLVIESCNYGTGSWLRRHHYYQYGYHLLPDGSTVTPYNGSLTPAQQAARNEVVNMVSNVGDHPAGPSFRSVTIPHGPEAIAAGGTLTLCSLSGHGQIRRLNLKMTGATDAELDGLRLRVRYGGRPALAVDVPVAHFFGAGHDRVPYKSLPLGTDGPDGFYCYWPMPFRHSVVVELHNSTDSDIHIDSAAVEYEPGGIAFDAGYLHACFSEETTVWEQQYHQMLTVSGPGHYVGNLLYVELEGTSESILEGDDIVTVDGAVTLYGTGLEDAYNGGFYYNNTPYGVQRNTPDDPPWPENGVGPYHGLLNMDDPNRPGSTDTCVRTDQYRWLIGDHVPFRESIDVKIENHAGRANVLFGSTTFYYLVFAVADFDWDGDVDRGDFAHFQACATGPSIAQTDPICRGADFDADGDVDQSDLGIFQRCISGQNNPADPGCAD